MTVLELSNCRILQADNGLYLTDNNTIGTTVIIPIKADRTVWYEITEKEKIIIENKQLEEVEVI